MQKGLNLVFNILGGAAALLVLFFVVASILSNFEEDITVTKETPVPISTQQPEPLIAFVSRDERGNGDIYTMKPDGSDLTNITNNPATDDSPAWLPDGTQIAFVSDRSGGRDIYVMNVDGSNVRKLTDSVTFNDHFSWSPDGKKIAYLSSEFRTSQLMVMNADGSDKVSLTDEPALYNILGWSPDGQKIVYQKWMDNPSAGSRSLDGGLYVIEINGENQHEWFTDTIYQIYWEDLEHFIGMGYDWNGERTKWSLFRFDTSGNAPIELAAHTIPIVAVFDRTYVVEGQDAWSWFAHSGAPIPTSPRNFSRICNTRTQPFMEETYHMISPDGQQDFVALNCPEGITHFFLMNADGTEFHPLGEALPNSLTLIAPYIAWSPDEKYVIVTLVNRNKQDLYLFDIQEMLKDPSVQPVQLPTNGVVENGVAWQPMP